jgi:protein phosphatase
MGGHAAGDLASGTAVRVLAESFAASRRAAAGARPGPTSAGLEPRLLDAVQLANHRIHEAAQANARLRGMGTTLVVAAIEGDSLCLAHVGDSRAYRFRGGAIERLTTDHSLFAALVAARALATDEAQRDFPHKNVITRALGVGPTVSIDVRREHIVDGDTFVLCSDGLCGMIDDGAILGCVERHPDLDAAATALVAAANEAGGSDNITVVLIRCEA